MTDQPDLAIVINDPPTFALRPGLILAVVICELPLTLLPRLAQPFDGRARTAPAPVGMPPDALGGRRS